MLYAVRSSKRLKGSSLFYLGSFLSALPIVYFLYLIGDGVVLENKVDGDYFNVAGKTIILSLYDDGTFKTTGVDAVFPAGTGKWVFNDYDWYEVELQYDEVNKTHQFWVESGDEGIELTYDPFSGVELVLVKGR